HDERSTAVSERPWLQFSPAWQTTESTRSPPRLRFVSQSKSPGRETVRAAGGFAAQPLHLPNSLAANPSRPGNFGLIRETSHTSSHENAARKCLNFAAPTPAGAALAGM